MAEGIKKLQSGLGRWVPVAFESHLEAVPMLKIAEMAEDLPSGEVPLALACGVGAILNLGQDIDNERG